MLDGEEEVPGEAAPENKLTLDNPAERVRLLKTAFDFFYELSPCVI